MVAHVSLGCEVNRYDLLRGRASRRAGGPPAPGRLWRGARAPVRPGAPRLPGDACRRAAGKAGRPLAAIPAAGADSDDSQGRARTGRGAGGRGRLGGGGVGREDEAALGRPPRRHRRHDGPLYAPEARPDRLRRTRTRAQIRRHVHARARKHTHASTHVARAGRVKG